MKKALGTIALVLVFLVGLLIMMYPTISEWYNNKVSSRVVASYRETSVSASNEERDAMFTAAEMYNDDLGLSTPVYINGPAEDDTYKNTLNLVNGVMGYITIDKIGVNLPVHHGTDEAVLQKAVGHLEGSHMPTGGIDRHTVVTGHTGLPSATLFSKLSSLILGDRFTFHILDHELVYEVVEMNVVLPYEVELLMPQAGRDLVTLITCTPYGVNSHRLLVMGERVIVEDESDEDTTILPTPPPEETVEIPLWMTLAQYVPYVLVGTGFMIIIFALSGAKRYHGSRVRGKDGNRKSIRSKRKPPGGRRLRR